MTAPVTPVLPVTQAAPASASQDAADSRAPFASALGDALSAGRGPAGKAAGRPGDPGRQAGDEGPDGRPGRGAGVRAGRARVPGEPNDGGGGPDDTSAPAGDASASLHGLPALLWSVLQGAPAPATETPAAAGPDRVGGVGAAPAAPGLPAGAVVATLGDPPASGPTGVAPATGTPVPEQATGPAVAPPPAASPGATASPGAAGTPAGGPSGDPVTGAVAGDLVVVKADAAPIAGPPGAPVLPAADGVASSGALPPDQAVRAAAPAAGAPPRAEAPPTRPAATDTGLPSVEPTAGPAAGPGRSSAGRDADFSDSSRPGPRPATTADASSAPVTAAVPAPAAVTTTTPAAAAPAQSPAPPVAGQLVPHVAVLGRSGDGTHSLTVVLRPDNLGPVQIQVTVSQGALDLTLRGAHEQGRAALLNALPELRRDLQSAGLDCSRLDVSRDTGGSWTSQHAAAGEGRGQPPWARPGPAESRPRPWAPDAEPARPASTTPSTTSATGVDVLV